jgi:ABC-2 type transport system permease protein
MSTYAYALTDSTTMLRRNLRRMRRNPGLTLFVAGIPIVILMLFVYVFGGTLGAGLPGVNGDDRGAYVDYLAPGILLLSITVGAMSTSISVAIDNSKGVDNRFRTMPISRTSVVTGHVVGSVLQVMISIVVVIGIAMICGFRPTAGPLGWLAAFGLMAMVSFALSWVAVGLGLVAKTVDSASNTPMFLQALPFLSSTFVPAAQMAPGLRWFSENEPFTPITETVRGLLLSKPVGDTWLISIIWCLVIAAGGYLWSRRLFNREPRQTG